MRLTEVLYHGPTLYSCSTTIGARGLAERLEAFEEAQSVLLLFPGHVAEDGGVEVAVGANDYPVLPLCVPLDAERRGRLADVAGLGKDIGLHYGQTRWSAPTSCLCHPHPNPIP